jgi:hypothetical protein
MALPCDQCGGRGYSFNVAAASEPEQHRRFDGMAVRHVLGDLDQADSQLFRTHLLDCGHCRARVGELRAIAHDLADIERDEARMRAAQRLGTKRRDEEEESPPSPQRRSRAWSAQPVIVLLLVAIISMGVWVFFLRAQVSELEGQLDAAIEASRTLEAGRSWEIDSPEALEVEVREDGDSLVVAIDGLADGDYRMEIFDPDGDLIQGQQARPTEGRLFVLMRELEADAASLRLVEEGDEDATPLVEARPEG